MTDTETLLAGRYRLGGFLGRGGMAAVHRAEDVVLERPVAVKVFEPQAAEPGRARSYEQEARILAGLSHPGLVTVFDAGVDATTPDGSRAFLVMELIDGATLADVLRDGPMESRAVAHLGAQIATALAYVHRKGVVHRDIKPANILLEESDEPDKGPHAKLTDFGIARLVDSARMTAEGLTVGTAAYLSPEQVGGGAVQAPTDVYSLGLVLLEALTGQVAFPGDGVASATERLRRDPQLPDWLDGAWVRLLTAMFERDPAARPGAAEAGLALTGLAVAPPVQEAPDMPNAETTALPVVDDAAPTTSGPHPTRVLEIPIPTPEPEVAEPVVVRARPTVRRVSRRTLAALGAALLFLIVLLVLILSTRGPSTVPSPPPRYPSVPGQLGTDLQKLERQVQP
ncbi:MAG TPA: serine/threonine-protein kinase [Jatrophihabitantaceae bacterium]|nr:serine/threonine-protein kinase [Jatrophihabitantaceae bacterium]